jgi:hypothetical protein
MAAIPKTEITIRHIHNEQSAIAFLRDNLKGEWKTDREACGCTKFTRIENTDAGKVVTEISLQVFDFVESRTVEVDITLGWEGD